MNTPRTNRVRLVFAALLCALSAAAPHAVAQGEDAQQQRQQPPPDMTSPESARARQLLEQGDDEGAIAVLRPAAERNRLDGEAWHLLGTAYARRGSRDDALKAFGLAVAVRLDRLSFGLVPNPERFVKFSPEQWSNVKAQALKLNGAALESVEEYLKLNPTDAGLWRAQAATLKAHAEFIERMPGEYAGARPDSAVVRLSIEAKPEPRYTEEARRHDTGGRVRVRAVFGADGKVSHVLATRPLPHGLTERAFEAARLVRFRPATVDGKPVSQFITLEYGFALDRRAGPLFGPGARPRIP